MKKEGKPATEIIWQTGSILMVIALFYFCTLDALPKSLINNSFNLEAQTGNAFNDFGATIFAYHMDKKYVYFVSAGHVTSAISKFQPAVTLTQPHRKNGISIDATINPEQVATASDRDLGVFIMSSTLFPTDFVPDVEISPEYLPQENCYSLGFAGATNEFTGWHALQGLSINWTQHTKHKGELAVKTITDQQTSGGDSGAAVVCDEILSGVHSGSNSLMCFILDAPIREDVIDLLESELTIGP